ncbi:MAG: class A beta-lactamase-related serine hydrolase [Flavobacteriaceae bacterium TMED120]|nr:MAG: class A beta-lactamase-related serine hydrolase [Flavobacteriaceae bacterium TMED120]
MKYIVFILLPFFAFAQFEHIKNFQKALIQEEKTGSNVALVYKEGHMIYHHIENSKKPGDKNIDGETIFPVWSMSKPITIVSVMTLVEAGKIKLEDPVSKYIPSFNSLVCKGSTGNYPCENQMTVYHLMTHRSGLKYYDEFDNIRGLTSSVKYENLEDFANDVSKVALEFEPGTRYLYGINQAVLGRIVEVASGMDFYQYLKKTIFDPLGMGNTKFYLTEEEQKHFQPLFINSDYLKGFTYLLNELTYKEGNKAYFGGEGLVSTFTDYAKFCRMLVNGGVFNGSRIIKQSSIDLMTKKHSEGYPVEDDAGYDQLGFYYGFSLFVLENPEIDGIGATKGIYGWSGYHNTHFWIDPQKKLFGLFMSRAREFDFDIQKRFRKQVYSLIQ